MKKEYISPQLTAMNIDTNDLLADSLDVKQDGTSQMLSKELNFIWENDEDVDMDY